MVMNQVQDVAKNVFHNQDLVLWHVRSDKRFLPIPGVVVHQEGNQVLIRARVEGKVQELFVPSDELITR